ncbi:glycosyltransferase family 4 protein [Akkermansiaceae bacterium]|nr:glycosyltransferase family 4 protein [Akkermansiaceae bacterium]
MSDESLNILYVSKYTSVENYDNRFPRSFQLLKSMADRGNRVTLLTSDSAHLTQSPVFTGAEHNEQVSGVEVYWLKTFKYKGAQSIRRVISWLHFQWRLMAFDHQKIGSPDVIIVSCLSLLPVLFALRIKKLYGAKFIFEVRDIWPLTLTEVGKVSSLHPLVIIMGWLEKLAYNRADAVVGTMPNLKFHVRKRGSTEVPVYCVPMGVTPDSVIRTSNLTFRRSSSFKVYYAGSIGNDNALEWFFLAAEKLQDYPDIEFHVVGEGRLKRNYAQKFKDNNNIKFKSRVSSDRIHKILQDADLLYFSCFNNIVWKSGQSLNKIIDYMLAGKPILGSYSGYQSMINEAHCGWFVPAENVNAIVEKILEIRQMDWSCRREMGERGRAWLIRERQFDLLARKYLEILKHVQE